jgi:ABC-2 type transport system ATP-binding protein
LDNVTLELHRGEIYGLCGPNGAGKTTLLKIISGLVHPTSGRVTFEEGEVVGAPGRVQLAIGIVPESPALVPEVSGAANLRLLGSIRGRVDSQDVAAVLRRVGLDPADRRRVGAYSLGMRARLGLAQALLESPRLLLLDEPTNGLDPLGIRHVQAIIKEEADRGAAVLMASHLLPVVERICHRVGIINGGRLVREITAGDHARALRLTVTTDEDWRRVAAWTDAISVQRQSGTIPQGIVYTNLEPPEAIRQLVALGVSIEAVQPHGPSLEDAFLQLVGGEKP